MSVTVQERSRGSERCPYCHDEVAEGKAWACPRCGTVHHDECAREAKKCTVLGCGQVVGGWAPPRAASPRAVTASPPSPAAERRAPHRVFHLVMVVALAIGGCAAGVTYLVSLAVSNQERVTAELDRSFRRTELMTGLCSSVANKEIAKARELRRAYEREYGVTRAVAREQVATYVRSNALHEGDLGRDPVALDKVLDEVFRDER